MLIREVLLLKKASVRSAPLPVGSPAWEEILEMSWETLETAAKENRPGFKTIRKLLSDSRFDR